MNTDELLSKIDQLTKHQDELEKKFHRLEEELKDRTTINVRGL